MSRPILLMPGEGLVEVSGEILLPRAAPLKIDVWRYARHPPPELLHVATIKPAQEEAGPRFWAGDADSLIGKVITWAWDCSALGTSHKGWKVRVDVRQGGQSTPGYPMEYAGPLPKRRPLSELRVAEPVRALR